MTTERGLNVRRLHATRDVPLQASVRWFGRRSGGAGPAGVKGGGAMTRHAAPRRLAFTFAFVTALLILASCASESSTTSTQRPGTRDRAVIDPGDGGHYRPEIDPSKFGGPIDNSFLPFLPGARWV